MYHVEMLHVMVHRLEKFSKKKEVFQFKIKYFRVYVWKINVYVKKDLLDQDVIQQIFVQLILVLMEVTNFFFHLP